MSMSDGGHAAADLYRRVARAYLSPLEYRVFPRCPLPVERLGNGAEAELPPLVRGYLRLGAYVCGAPERRAGAPHFCGDATVEARIVADQVGALRRSRVAPTSCGRRHCSAVRGAPAWDPDFNTADVLVLLPMSRINPRYAEHYFGVGSQMA
jgi:putative hemolysin